MTTTATMDETYTHASLLPGRELATIREERGYSIEYVAGKLHLRSDLIAILEADDYARMPELVFIRGYIRGYAKLLDIPADPLIDAFNRLDISEKKVEKALWQSKKEKHTGETIIRWVTALFAIGVVVAVGLWWHNNQDNEHYFAAANAEIETVPVAKSESDIRLTDLSKMREILTSSLPFTPVVPNAKVEPASEQ